MPRRSAEALAQRTRILERLYEHGLAFDELGRAFSTRMALHTTDASALVEILQAQDRGAPLTQSELSRRVGLTPGATSSLLNRLEVAGHVRRERTDADRRIVTLHATAEVDKRVDGYFDPLSRAIGALLPGYDPATLGEIERFLGEVVAVMNAYAREQR